MRDDRFTVVQLDNDLHRIIKVRSAETTEHMRDITSRLIRQGLEAEKRSATPKRRYKRAGE